MVLVEELPNSAAPTAPGWAYVPDTGYDPSKAPIIPSGARKRQNRNAPIAAARGNTSVRQQNKIARYLADLDKDNPRDVQIAPNKTRETSGRGLRDKMTSGVRKIMLSQKTFANHLADEEAAFANPSTAPGPTSVKRASNKVVDSPAQKKNRASMSRPTSSSDARVVEVSSVLPSSQDVLMQDTMLVEQQLPITEFDNDPLLQSRVPPLPLAEVIEALLSAPALSYSAARAAPSTSTAPARQFCEICGYWGRMRCLKCGARICGLECKNSHEESNRCLLF